MAATVLLGATQPSSPPAQPDPDALRSLVQPVRRCDLTTRPDEIVVCARDREVQRQKLPLPVEPTPGDPRNLSVSRERNALIERTDGQMVCDSTVGPGAGYGCLARDMHRDADQNPKPWPSLPRVKPADPPPL